MTTYKTTTAEIFTPAYDMTIDRPYAGNHMGYLVTFFRDGDAITVSHYGEKGHNPVRPLLKAETHSITNMVSSLRAFAIENGMSFDCGDNIPNGFSHAAA